jgi:hypothetical protein
MNVFSAPKPNPCKTQWLKRRKPSSVDVTVAVLSPPGGATPKVIRAPIIPLLGGSASKPIKEWTAQFGDPALSGVFPRRWRRPRRLDAAISRLAKHDHPTRHAILEGSVGGVGLAPCR